MHYVVFSQIFTAKSALLLNSQFSTAVAVTQQLNNKLKL